MLKVLVGLPIPDYKNDNQTIPAEHLFLSSCLCVGDNVVDYKFRSK
jgi:hypothetical protein